MGGVILNVGDVIRGQKSSHNVRQVCHLVGVFVWSHNHLMGASVSCRNCGRCHHLEASTPPGAGQPCEWRRYYETTRNPRRGEKTHVSTVKLTTMKNLELNSFYMKSESYCVDFIFLPNYAAQRKNNSGL